MKSVDKKPSAGLWGEKFPFNTVCREFSNGDGGWVHGVAFAPSGNAVAWVGHDASVTVSYPASEKFHYRVKTPNLPLLALLFVTENSLVAVGHDCVPYLFSGDESGW